MMFEDEFDQEKKGFFKVDLEGSNPKLWAALHQKFILALFEILDFNDDKSKESHVDSEFKRIEESIITYANSQGRNRSIEDLKIFAEVENLLADKAKKISEARSIDAETARKRFDLNKEKLRHALGVAKMLSATLRNPDLIVFTKNIEELYFLFQEKDANN
ncbi:hypothetical protein ABIC45_002002 [Mucilaginibacter rubeus]|uniref:hypothetical protein n=1 Tax=Mucilaginibacter rubeus TaxID=2027860 RepID=UPI003391E9AB